MLPSANLQLCRLRDKVKEFFKREHPLKKAVNDLDMSLLFGIAHSMNVPYDKTSEQGLRKATCDAIFKAAPKNPLACYEAKMEGVRAMYDADDRAAQEALAPNPNGAGGFPLHNPSNACFGISAVNLMLAPQSLRDSLDPHDPIHQSLIQIRERRTNSVLKVLGALNLAVHRRVKYVATTQNDACDVVRDLLMTIPLEQREMSEKIVDECPRCHRRYERPPLATTVPLVDVRASVKEMLTNSLSFRNQQCLDCWAQNPEHKVYKSIDVGDSTKYLVFASARATNIQDKNKITKVDKLLDLSDETFQVCAVITHIGDGAIVSSGNYREYTGHYTTSLYSPETGWTCVSDSDVHYNHHEPTKGYVYLYEKLDHSSPLHQRNRQGDAASPDTSMPAVQSAPPPLQPSFKQQAHDRYARVEATKWQIEKTSKAKKTTETKEKLKDELSRNIEVLAQMRKQGIDSINANESIDVSLQLDNPILIKSRECFDKLDKHYSVPKEACPVCCQAGIHVELMPRKKMCQRCNNEINRGNKAMDDYIPQFSAENLMQPTEIPPELEDLTTIEKLTIKKVTPMMQVYTRRCGKMGLKGNTIAFMQDLQPIANVLPRLPENIPIVVLQSMKHKDLDLKIRPQKVLDALRWLKKNNPFYSDIVISEDNLRLAKPQIYFTDLNQTY